MEIKKPTRPIPGSAPKRILPPQIEGLPDPQEVVEVTLYLRRRATISKEVTHGRRPHLTHEEFEKSHGAQNEALERVKAFAEEHGLKVVEASAAKRRVRLEGTVEALGRAFGVALVHLRHPEGLFRGHEGEVQLPEELHDIVGSVLGLDNRPMARRNSASTADETIDPDHRPDGSFTAFEVAAAYDFPTDLDGSGQCVGIIELGGGYFEDEFETYFGYFDLRVPEVSSVGPNRPGPRQDPSPYNLEVALDFEVVGSVAPKAKYVLYFGECTDMGFVNILKDAIHDSENSPSVLSVSWSMAETDWSKNAAEAMEETLEDAVALGITVCVSSGDHGSYGSSEGIEEGEITPVIPASVPHALGCGGTRMTVNGKRYDSEVVWNQLDTDRKGASGGGVSSYFGLPDYQSEADVPAVPEGGENPGFNGRGIPDVAGHGDPRVGYLMYCSGEWSVHAGTSAVAPLWAGLIALLNQGLGQRLGFVTPKLYELMKSEEFHQITSGNNGHYKAQSGWNACTGLGTPIGSKLLKALEKQTKG